MLQTRNHGAGSTGWRECRGNGYTRYHDRIGWEVDGGSREGGPSAPKAHPKYSSLAFALTITHKVRMLYPQQLSDRALLRNFHKVLPELGYRDVTFAGGSRTHQGEIEDLR
jgi:hypothetical protein